MSEKTPSQEPTNVRDEAELSDESLDSVAGGATASLIDIGGGCVLFPPEEGPGGCFPPSPVDLLI